MQVALPRTQDAGKMQDNMVKQGQHFQESLAQTQRKQEERTRKRVNEFEKTEKVKNKEQHSKNLINKKTQLEQSEEEYKMNHPYLGSQIDFNG
ncbi:hypothetical protein [Oceanobacillus profundus]|jgi:hypothetical protein|nr:hypothetical protein [Oceanobacillus profundus]MCM3396377.1 hypothetical protein [Oceanobacillus profundus]